MKTLKVKLGLFSLLAVIAVSIFLTACEQEKTFNEALQETEKMQSEVMVLPKGYSKNMTNEELVTYFASLTAEERDELVENNRIIRYLVSINKFEDVEKHLNYGGLFTKIDLGVYLSLEELQKLKKFNPEYEYYSQDLESRGFWGSWNNVGSHNVCGAPCCEYNILQRTCHRAILSDYTEQVICSVCDGCALPLEIWCW